MEEPSGTRLYLRRKRAKLSRRQLSQLTGISQRQLARYERAGVVPPLDRAQALARALGCRLDDLLDEADRPRRRRLAAPV